jgi:hypothetical protein
VVTTGVETSGTAIRLATGVRAEAVGYAKPRALAIGASLLVLDEPTGVQGLRCTLSPLSIPLIARNPPPDLCLRDPEPVVHDLRQRRDRE